MKNLKLTKIAENQLSEKEMKNLKGGEVYKRICGCACKYANQGGSSTNDNRCANVKNNLASEGGPDGIYMYNTVTGHVHNLLGQCLNC